MRESQRVRHDFYWKGKKHEYYFKEETRSNRNNMCDSNDCNIAYDLQSKNISPEMDIIEFDTKDVITTRGIGGEAGDPADTLIDVNKNTNWSDFY